MLNHRQAHIKDNHIHTTATAFIRKRTYVHSHTDPGTSHGYMTAISSCCGMTGTLIVSEEGEEGRARLIG